ncbi:porin [Shinella sp. NM-101]|uniref:porin n=1 Tax=Shinella sp. NM-101 TaxID=2744455 RepID=UPI001F1AB5BB|nr:porin [Shinella sp. NM-101]
MNIKSLLIGSAAALAAVSGAQAADAIVAAEPEPMEYVRVCDAFGTGFFYIPGTETCLKIGGFVRFQTSFGSDNYGVGVGSSQSYLKSANNSDWDAHTLVDVNFDARTDTELGTLRSYINFEGLAGGAGAESDFYVDEAFIELGGFKAGWFYSWWDSGINGEVDSLGSTTEFNSIAYTYDGGTWRAGLSLDELDGGANGALVWNGTTYVPATDRHHDIGVAATIGFSLGGVNLDILGGYDNAAEEGAIRAILSAELGAGTLQVAGIWASDSNVYWTASEWTVAASYAFKATEKLTITPAFQYFNNIGFGPDDQWRVGATVGYEVVSGLNVLATADYNTINHGGDDFVRGFLRLQRNF